MTAGLPPQIARVGDLHSRPPQRAAAAPVRHGRRNAAWSLPTLWRYTRSNPMRSQPGDPVGQFARRRRRRARLCAAVRRSDRPRAHRTPRAARCPSSDPEIAACRHCSRAIAGRRPRVFEGDVHLQHARTGSAAPGTHPPPFAGRRAAVRRSRGRQPIPRPRRLSLRLTAAPRSGGGAAGLLQIRARWTEIVPSRETSSPGHQVTDDVHGASSRAFRCVLVGHSSPVTCSFTASPLPSAAQNLPGNISSSVAMACAMITG